MLHQLQPFAIALAIGLLIGTERERNHPPGSQAMGLRTFVLLALFGSIATSLNNTLVSCAFALFVGAIITISYLRSTSARRDTNAIGITTEIAGAVTFALGLFSYNNPLTALVIAVTVVIILNGKEHLHAFTRKQLRTEEFQATIMILILGLGILPLLPNTPIDPWKLINLQQFGILMVSIAIMQFGAYVTSRMFGADRGLTLAGFLSGFISSAIATFQFTQQIKNKEITLKPALAAIIYATIAMFVKLLVIIYLISDKIFSLLIWPSCLAMICGIVAVNLLKNHHHKSQKEHILKNPINILSALKLASVLVGMLILLTLAKRFFGLPATHIIAFLGGLFDIHSISFAVVSLFEKSELTTQDTLFCLWLSIFASFISKWITIFYAFKINRKFALLANSFLLLMLIAFTLIWFLLLAHGIR